MKLVSELKSLLHRGQNSKLPKASDGLNILGQVTEQEWDKIMSIQIYTEAAEYGPNLYASGGQGADMADTVRDLVKYQRKELNELYDATLKKIWALKGHPSHHRGSKNSHNRGLQQVYCRQRQD